MTRRGAQAPVSVQSPCAARRRVPVVKRESGKLFDPANEESVIADHQCTGPRLYKTCEYGIEVAFAGCVQDAEPQSQGAGRHLQHLREGIGVGIRRVDKQGDDGRGGDQFVH